MADVFLSYAREDRDKADHIARMLESEGFDVFWDNEIPPGSSWADFIESKLRSAKAMIVLWSESSTTSQWVREEARLGRDAGKLIPAALDSSSPPFGFGEVQSADLSGWDGDPNHPDWNRFVSAVNSRIGIEEAPPTSTSTAFTSSPTPSQGFASGAAAATGRAGFSQQSQTTQSATTTPSGSSNSFSPIGYIQKCLKLYAVGKGRARQAEYWWFLLFQFVVGFIGGVIDIAVFGYNSIFTLVALFSLVTPAVATASRRLHDFNANGWIAAIVIVPYLGWIASLVIGFIPGKPGENQYGPDPRNPENLETVFS